MTDEIIITEEIKTKYPLFADFTVFRTEMNEKILGLDHLGIKRFFTLDDRAYDEGAIPVKYKELMGLSASMVLRCEGCINYHVATSVAQGITKEELTEAYNIALIIGGSIVIPHLRTAVKFMEECLEIYAEQPEMLKKSLGMIPRHH